MLSNTHPGYFVQCLPGMQCPFPLDTLSSVSKHLSFFCPYMFRNHNQQCLFHGNPTQSMATSHCTYAPSSSPTYKLLAWNDLCLRLAQQSNFAILLHMPCTDYLVIFRSTCSPSMTEGAFPHCTGIIRPLPLCIRVHVVQQGHLRQYVLKQIVVNRRPGDVPAEGN